MDKNYLEIMINSLKSKQKILEHIMQLCREQDELLDDPSLDPDTFEENVRAKAELIDQLTGLDNGFEEVFQRVAEELKRDKSQYADEIHSMQELIRTLTDLSVEIQTAELRNKEKAQNKFAAIREQVRNVRTSQKLVNTYYRNMMKINHIEPQFLDNKK